MKTVTEFRNSRKHHNGLYSLDMYVILHYFLCMCVLTFEISKYWMQWTFVRLNSRLHYLVEYRGFHLFALMLHAELLVSFQVDYR
jgi:hypothetical protein